MMFVHGGLFQLVINMGCLVQLGMLLERFVGRGLRRGLRSAGVLAGMVSSRVSGGGQLWRVGRHLWRLRSAACHDGLGLPRQGKERRDDNDALG
jgi:hypothetical protein